MAEFRTGDNRTLVITYPTLKMVPEGSPERTGIGARGDAEGLNGGRLGSPAANLAR